LYQKLPMGLTNEYEPALVEAGVYLVRVITSSSRNGQVRRIVASIQSALCFFPSGLGLSALDR
jgi:hypothetical protein